MSLRLTCPQRPPTVQVCEHHGCLATHGLSRSGLRAPWEPVQAAVHTSRCARASGDPCVSVPPLAAAISSKPVDAQPSTPPALSGKSSDGSESEEVPPKKRRMIHGGSE